MGGIELSLFRKNVTLQVDVHREVAAVVALSIDTPSLFTDFYAFPAGQWPFDPAKSAFFVQKLVQDSSLNKIKNTVNIFSIGFLFPIKKRI